MGKVVIICEGAEDVNFLKALVMDRGLNGFEFQWDYEFKGARMGGVTNFPIDPSARIHAISSREKEDGNSRTVSF